MKDTRNVFEITFISDLPIRTERKVRLLADDAEEARNAARLYRKSFEHVSAVVDTGRPS